MLRGLIFASKNILQPKFVLRFCFVCALLSLLFVACIVIVPWSCCGGLFCCCWLAVVAGYEMIRHFFCVVNNV